MIVQFYIEMNIYFTVNHVKIYFDCFRWKLQLQKSPYTKIAFALTKYNLLPNQIFFPFMINPQTVFVN